MSPVSRAELAAGRSAARLQVRGVPGSGQLGSGGLGAEVVHVLVLPCRLPQVVIVVAGQVVDDRIEHRLAGTERQVGELAEHHRGHLVRGQGQVQDVSGQDQRRWPVLVTGELAQAVDEPGQHRARPPRVGGEASVRAGRGALVERGQHAVLGPEVQIGHDHVADISHGGALLVGSARCSPHGCEDLPQLAQEKLPEGVERPDPAAQVRAAHPERRQLPGEVGRGDPQDP